MLPADCSGFPLYFHLEKGGILKQSGQELKRLKIRQNSYNFARDKVSENILQQNSSEEISWSNVNWTQYCQPRMETEFDLMLESVVELSMESDEWEKSVRRMLNPVAGRRLKQCSTYFCFFKEHRIWIRAAPCKVHWMNITCVDEQHLLYGWICFWRQTSIHQCNR